MSAAGKGLIASLLVLSVLLYARSLNSLWSNVSTVDDEAVGLRGGGLEKAIDRLEAIAAKLETGKQREEGDAAEDKAESGERKRGEEQPTESEQMNFLGEDDPIDTSSFQGPFRKSYTMKEIKMCDPETNIVMAGHWKCTNDPTCASCSAATIDRFQDVFMALNEDTAVSARRDLVVGMLGEENVAPRKDWGAPQASGVVRTRAPNGTKKDVVLVVVNYGQLYLLFNFLCSLHALKLNPKEFVIVIPTDMQTYEMLAPHTNTIHPKWTKNLKNPISSTYDGRPMTGSHAAINNVLLIVANEIMQMTSANLLMQDADIAWKDNVLVFLRKSISRRDLLGQVSPFANAKGGLNTGFLYFRNTQASRVLLQTLVNVAPLKARSDQELFNIVLRRFEFRELAYRALPQEVIYKYSGRSAPKPGKNAQVFHSVGPHKRSSFLWSKTWYFTVECPWYDKELDDFSLSAVDEGESPPEPGKGVEDGP